MDKGDQPIGAGLVTIDLEPVGRRIRVPSGTSLLDAARRAGVEIVASCGGVGICGTCLVRVMDGQVSALNSSEQEMLDAEQIRDGLRMACQATALSDLRLDIPATSLLRAQRLQIEGQESQFDMSPLVRGFDLRCKPPEMDDLRADKSRIDDVLCESGMGTLIASPAQVSGISDLLRSEGWRAKLAVDTSSGKTRLAAALKQGTPLLGLAMDLGSTKLAFYLIDMESGGTLAAWGCMNPQIAYGEDVVSRIAYSNRDEEERGLLHQILVDTINQELSRVCGTLGYQVEQIVDITAVGNTAMHHFFAGLPVKPLGHAPYVPVVQESMVFNASEIGLKAAHGAQVYLAPNIAGYVGADHVSALVASQPYFQNGAALLVDIGTNTEISLVRDGRMLSCSCASGPAFEGAHIRDGMRAAPGAIEKVQFWGRQPIVHTIGDQPAVGICGSGIVHALAGMLQVGVLDYRGLIDGKGGGQFTLVPGEASGHGREIVVTRKDVNEIQLAKGAIRGGIETLLGKVGLSARDLESVVVAGAFGTHLDLRSAIRLGMFPDLPMDRFYQVGNAAGVGARQMLLSVEKRKAAENIRSDVEYLELTIVPEFTHHYTSQLFFPSDGSKKISSG